MHKDLDIEVVVSTLNDGLHSIKFNKDFKYLIIHQVSENHDLTKYESFLQEIKDVNFRYIRDFNTGLSRSRNIGLSNSKADYVWIMDDDVVILDGIKSNIIDYIENKSSDILILNYTNDINLVRTDLIEKKLGYISSATVSSINMLIKLESVKDVRFDENFGLGTKYPSGEEYIFCCDMLKRGKEVYQTNLVASYHPIYTSGSDFYSSPNKLAAKKKMFIRCHGKLYGTAFYMMFLTKKIKVLIKNKAFKNVINSFFH